MVLTPVVSVRVPYRSKIPVRVDDLKQNETLNYLFINNSKLKYISHV